MVALLREVAAAAAARSIPWFVGGASARDILLAHVHDIEPTRATADVDIGICIESWDGHEALRTELLASGYFEQRGNATHRLDYRVPASGARTWLDIVPFGRIADDRGEIAWPPDQVIRMNVAGFEEALRAAVLVRMDADLVVPVASLPSQAMLKIIAWQDRHAIDRKDATDLLFLLAWYGDAGNLERLYADDGFDLIERHEHDPDVAGAALLGRDMAAIVTPEVGDQILAVLAPDDPSPLMLTHMMASRTRIPGGDSTERSGQLFDAFRQEFLAAVRRER
ncbi:nucleotidyl transferase AbiEii/AbiGii toxin family protein [Burkholderia cenocepacia]|uniref:nucleotidyl transferase AbiEii/AbiGii toxin family protein n=1 Tax=Burkholderia cenocepacia TaxID=95486 RepID=UPI00285531B7|nr:nucleotidyl transferase AbiEii/AbiGii toxin family protein [Burkholderia cenocepacia]MDR5646436.1 nucleotidyl transferase AbiEii/AbiGii toxin family protein [Burkholderia cenocepacia]